MVLLISLLIQIVKIQLVSPIFLETASDFVEVGYKKSTRLGETQHDISMIEVSVKLMYMIEDISKIDRHRVSLEIKENRKEWKVLQAQPVIRGGVYTWTEENSAPCSNHSFRLWVHTTSGEQRSYELPSSLHGLNTSQLIQQKYKPQAPGQLEIVETLYALVISWAPSSCVEFYYLSYRQTTSNTWQSRKVTALDRPSLLISDDVESCTEYEIKIISAIADSYSSETIKYFTTSPQSQAADKLNVSISNVEKHDVSIRWTPHEDLPCVPTYNVSFCQEKAGCSLHWQVTQPQNSVELFSANKTLQECTKYYLKILPIFDLKKMQEKVVHFQTKFPPLTNLSHHLVPITASVSPNLIIHLSWRKVKCAHQYQVFEKRSKEWHLLNTTELTSFRYKAMFCKQYMFGIRTFVGSHKSEIVPLQNNLVTNIENPEYYILPNFKVEGNLHGARLSWDHR